MGIHSVESDQVLYQSPVLCWYVSPYCWDLQNQHSFNWISKGALTLGNHYCAQARLTPKVQFVWPVWALHTVYTFLTLARLEEVCFDTQWLLMHEHKHGWAMCTWSIIMRIMPPCMIKKSRNARGLSVSEMTQNKQQKKICKITVLLSMLLSIVWTGKC